MISPMVRRMRLGAELKALRLSAGLTHEQVAKQIRQSRMKISRIENGNIRPDVGDVLKILDVFGVDGDQWTQLAKIARDASERGWWHSIAERVGPRQVIYADLEAGAETIRDYEQNFIPGLVQTIEYTSTPLHSNGVRHRVNALCTRTCKGECTPARIAGRLKRGSHTMSYPLSILRRAGFISYDDDLLTQRKPVVAISDPIIRFHHTIVSSRRQDFEDKRRAPRARQDAKHTFDCQILGPHFEHLARQWTLYEARDRLQRDVGYTGRTAVPCREHKVSHEVDVISLEGGIVPHTDKDARIFVLGEAKSTEKVRGTADLDRLRHVRDLLGDRAADASLLVFSRTGFNRHLEEAQRRDDVTLVSLADMFDLH